MVEVIRDPIGELSKIQDLFQSLHWFLEGAGEMSTSMWLKFTDTEKAIDEIKQVLVFTFGEQLE